jgi:drug/metabolite transporter (DMT)-like permease
MNTKLKEWAIFIGLGLIWGTSFLWIKLALQEIGPFTLVTLRLLFGLAGLLAIMRLQGLAFPRQPRALLKLAVVAVLNYALPFTLISWGETRIDSSLASILNGTVPLFTILIAHVLLPDEKITPARLAGLLVGFGGVLVLVSRDLGPGAFTGNVWGQLAVIGAAASYALAITFARKTLRGQSPVVTSAGSFVAAVALMGAITPVAEPGWQLPALPLTWAAVAWLGLLGSSLAFVFFYRLINAWGPTRASLVTYIFPVIGLALGILFLNEPADWRLGVGSLLVVSGIVIVNLRMRARVAPAARLAAAGTD